MYAATPPARCALATTWRQGVAVPLHSGAKISVTRPRGIPPTPIAASRLIAPVGMDSTRTRSVDPIFMMAPLPQFFSIWAIARFSAFFLSSLTVDTAISFHPVVRRFDLAGRWISLGLGAPGQQTMPCISAPEQTTKLRTNYQDFQKEISAWASPARTSF